MQVKGHYTVPVPREKVWAYFTDPTFVQQCIPGCEKLEPLGDDTFEATLSVGIASIKGEYKGTVKIENKQPPTAYRLVVEGGSQLGFVKGTGDLTLQEAPQNQTEIIVEGEVQVGGKIARVGQRILGSAAKMMMDRFFKNAADLVTSST
jgi:hypothetical protein